MDGWMSTKGWRLTSLEDLSDDVDAILVVVHLRIGVEATCNHNHQHRHSHPHNNHHNSTTPNPLSLQQPPNPHPLTSCSLTMLGCSWYLDNSSTSSKGSLLSGSITFTAHSFLLPLCTHRWHLEKDPEPNSCGVVGEFEGVWKEWLEDGVVGGFGEVVW